ncbi:MAG TPA: carbon-nitrogen hydrolase family protein [Ohtaekwangia sp.]|uniref:carbon-nitrogen hydrolase family protein n=1 Tax=Ohtaekwangia sp. TaxID=2066019 RepID=UPI002F923E28
MNKVVIAIGQYGPVFLDLEKSLEKLVYIVKEAAMKEAHLLVLGESWFSGYPSWLDFNADVANWDNGDMKEAYWQIYSSSVAVKSSQMQVITTLAKENKITLAFGFNERVDAGPGNGTIYNSFAIVDQHGQIAVHHRKLVPTFNERLVYGNGDGVGLQAAQISWGRIGGSICWEHWMPLTRQALHDAGEHIHVAFWPSVNEIHTLASRHYAFEGRCFVVAVGQLLSCADLPSALKPLPEKVIHKDGLLLNGGSCIIAPNGEFITSPVYDREALIVAEVDLSETIKERLTLDTSGHYQRRDVFSFKVKDSHRDF